VLYFISWKGPNEPENPNISFDQLLLSVDIDLGRGNPGAIAVDHQGAQGCATEDVHVEARDGFAGFRGAHGSGGSMSHISVRGGRYGLYLAGLGALAPFRGSQPSPVISYVTLTGQTEAAIFSDVRGPLTLVGAWIEGAGIRVRSSRNDFDGALNVLDSVIRCPLEPVIASNRPVYLRNVFFEGAQRLIQLEGKDLARVSSPAWQHVVEFAGSPSPLHPVWVNGQRQAGPVVQLEGDTPPPDDFRKPHAWDEKLPSWMDPRVVHVKQPPYLAKGDGQTDDTIAIQRALGEHRDVFLPKGTYRISRPLRLGPANRLFGLGVYSKIEPTPEARAFADPEHPSPIIETADSADATCALAFLQLWCRHPGSYAIHWRAGARSLVRNVSVKAWPWPEGAPPASHPMVLIEGNGGGRWYNLYSHLKFPQAPAHRLLLVRNTTQPLVFYMLNPEHSAAPYMVELENARNVTIYGVKAETIGAGGPTESSVFRIAQSRNFAIYGHGGNASAPAGHSLYLIERSSHFTLANFTYQFFREATPAQRWFLVTEQASDGRSVNTPATEFFVVYKRQ